MDTNALWKSGERLAPIAVEPNSGQKRLPPFSHLISPAGLHTFGRVLGADASPKSIPRLLPARSPTPTPPRTVVRKQRSHTHAPSARPTPSSPLAQVQRAGLNNSQRFRFETQPSPPRSVASTSPSIHRKSGQRSNTGPTSRHDLANAGGPSKGVTSPAPMLPPSPPLTSYSSEPNLSTHGASTVSTITSDAARDKPLPYSTLDENIDEYITTLIKLDMKNTGLVQDAREELDSLFGRKGDPFQLAIDAQQRRRESLLVEWGQDPIILLKDRSLENFTMRCMILDIDRRVRVLQTARQSGKPNLSPRQYT